MRKRKKIIKILKFQDFLYQESVDIWNKFLDFESNIGDLASVIKVN